MHGEGELHWPDGRVYRGSFRQNQQYGFGSSVSLGANGSTYEGSWKDGKMNGYGILKYLNQNLSSLDYLRIYLHLDMPTEMFTREISKMANLTDTALSKEVIFSLRPPMFTWVNGKLARRTAMASWTILLPVKSTWACGKRTTGTDRPCWSR